MTTNFFKNWKGQEVEWTGEYLKVGGRTIMYSWERPLMRKFAELLAGSHGDVLEIGFGMGILSGEIQKIGVRSHTILEPHPLIVNKARQWSNKKKNIHIIEDYWQACHKKLGKYDGIMFDPVEEESFENDTFAFFEISSAKLLRDGGRLAFFYPQLTLSNEYQEAILKHFDHFSVYAVKGLKPSSDFIEKGITDTMLAIVVYK